MTTSYRVAVVPDPGRGRRVDYIAQVQGTGRVFRTLGDVSEAEHFESEQCAEEVARACRRSWVGFHHSVLVEHVPTKPFLTRLLGWVGL